MKPPLFVFLLLLCLFLPYVSNSQSHKGELRGRLLDLKSKEALPYATVAVYTAADTVMVTFRMSDEKGDFKITNLPLDKELRTVVTMMGFKIFRKEFKLSAEKPVSELGVISMEQSSSLLSEVVILAEIPPVLVRNDTLEFNAASFKTLPTSLVEDLLKKLPGVTVDGAGNIMVNGKAVNKILVDGKEFFGSDPKVASRNLPADVIEKVQVMNDPEALLRDPDMAQADIPQVINLTFKKGIKKGMFGKLYGGAGTKQTYEGGGILNMFRDTTQVSLVGFSNNLSRQAFSFGDLNKLGGFDRSGVNMIAMRSDGGLALNGVSFGGMEEGIQQTSGGGANFNTVTKSGTKINTQYFFGDVSADLNQVVNTEQFLKADTLNSRRDREQYSRIQSHRLGGRVEWKLDSLTQLSISPGVNLSYRSSNQNGFISTLQNHATLLNESENREVIDNKEVSISNTLSLQRNFKKKGRLFSLYSWLNYTTTVQDQTNDAENIFYQPELRTTYLNQLRNTDRQGINLNNTFSYTEPIKKDLSAVIRANVEYFRDKNVLETYQANPENGVYDEFVTGLSNGLDRSGWRNYLTTGIKWKVKDVTFQPGVRFTSLVIQNKFQTAKPIGQDSFFVFPNLNINWKQFFFTYSVDSREPNVTSLQPVQDNTNPLFIQFGNPNLKPTISNNINLSYRKYDTKRSLNLNAYAYGSYSKDAVTRERVIDRETGVQTSRFVNTDGNWNLSGTGRISKDYKYDNNGQFSITASTRVSYSKTLILLNGTRSFGQTWGVTPELEGRMNLDDKLEFTQSFALNQQRSFYENNVFDDIRYNIRTSKSGIVIRRPNKLVWEATYDYIYNSNVAPGLQKSIGRLNGGVTFLFMQNDRAQLKLSVYDLLNQNINAYRTIRENSIEDYQTVVLNRYGMLTFTYNIRNFGGKVGGRSNPIFMF